MTAYLLRRVLYAVPILLGVNGLTFVLFFVVNTPAQMARLHLGGKHTTPQQIEKWVRVHGYDRPVLFNRAAPGRGKVTDTIFFQHSARLFAFRFGRSDRDRDIGHEIYERMGPSLAIAVPTFFVGLGVYLTFALGAAYFRGTYIDGAGVVLCVVLMSVSTLFYVIGGQFLVSQLLRIVPISGYDTGADAARFVVLPALIGIASAIGHSTRLYRTYFLEETGKDYVRTARAKGVPERGILFRHVLKNALVPILTGVVVVIPSLFLGSLIMESFFGIPGLGSYTIDAIRSQDFAIVRSMVFLGSVLYIVGLVLTDVAYTLVDPRIRLS